LDRLLKDISSAELVRLRPGQAPTGNAPGWDQNFGGDGLDLDSPERLCRASAVAEGLHFGAAQESERLTHIDRFGQLAVEVRRRLPSVGATIDFLTSGSAGRPKRVRHPLAGLEETAALADLVGPVHRILSMIPVAPIFGLRCTTRLHRRLGVPVLDLRGQAAGCLASCRRPRRGHASDLGRSGRAGRLG
jgi:hypothetical protein